MGLFKKLGGVLGITIMWVDDSPQDDVAAASPNAASVAAQRETPAALEARTWRRQSLCAAIVPACRCGAPGFYHDIEGVNVACYDPGRLNEPVGAICPACGADRPVAIEPYTGKPVGAQGSPEIWVKEFK